jgi:hypothetical protein
LDVLCRLVEARRMFSEEGFKPVGMLIEVAVSSLSPPD